MAARIRGRNDTETYCDKVILGARVIPPLDHLRKVPVSLANVAIGWIAVVDVPVAKAVVPLALKI